MTRDQAFKYFLKWTLAIGIASFLLWTVTYIVFGDMSRDTALGRFVYVAELVGKLVFLINLVFACAIAMNWARE